MNSKSKYVYLGLFIFGIVMIIWSTKIMLAEGFLNTIGGIVSSDRRCIYTLISAFGAIGFFIEIIFEKIYQIKEKEYRNIYK